MSNNFCIHPLIELNVTPKYVTPCCFSFLPYDFAYKVKWTSILAKSAWSSESWLEYRKAIASDDYSKCGNCPYYMCRDTEFVTEESLREQYPDYADDVMAFRNGDYTKLAYPKIVEASYDISCNLACETCRPEITKSNPAVVNAITSQIKPMVDSASEIIIGGDGEIAISSTYQNLLRDSSSNCKVSIMSNGNLLDESFWGKFGDDVKFRIKSVLVSVDGTTKEVYETIRKFGNFDRLCENLELLHVMKDRYGFRTKMAYTISRFNMEDCHNATGFARRFGFDSLFMAVARTWMRDLPKKYDGYKGAWVSSDSLVPSEKLAEMKEYARKYTGDIDKNG